MACIPSGIASGSALVLTFAAYPIGPVQIRPRLTSLVRDRHHDRASFVWKTKRPRDTEAEVMSNLEVGRRARCQRRVDVG
jgi:hypothetical protein